MNSHIASADVHVAGFSVAKGPVAGNTLVTVTGTQDFINSWETGTLRCRFDTEIVVGTFVTSSTMQCYSPGHSATSGVPLEISSNNQDYSTEGMTFEYQDDVDVTLIFPIGGSTAGGTIVTVSGDAFTSAATCRFNLALATSATVQSSSTMLCESPAHAAGLAAVEVTNNGQQFTGLDVQYQYYEPLQVTNVLPTTGPVDGHTVVTVYGSNFIGSMPLLCAFGTTIQVSASWKSSSELRCESPSEVSGTVSVEVSNNNQDYTSDAVSFEYQATIQVSGVSVSNGPELGNTLVTVTGSNFVQSDKLRCRFDLDVVSATVVSASTTALQCVTPTHDPSTQLVEVSNNDQDYVNSAGVTFTFDYTVHVEQVDPPLGDAAGGTLVTVSGSEFRSPAWCRFDVTAGIVATVQSSSQLVCTSPSHVAGPVAVEISNNNQDYSTDLVQYLYYGMFW